jgi:hypothetical protein
MKDFKDVWADILKVVKKHQVLYAPESRKMQVINSVTNDTITYTDDPTHKPSPSTIKAADFETVWKALSEKGVVDENEIRELVGKKNEFIWTVMERLDYVEYDMRSLRLKE